MISLRPSARTLFTGSSNDDVRSVWPATVAGMRFIGGVPMNCATNAFAGRSYTSRGVPTC